MSDLEMDTDSACLGREPDAFQDTEIEFHQVDEKAVYRRQVIDEVDNKPEEIIVSLRISFLDHLGDERISTTSTMVPADRAVLTAKAQDKLRKSINELYRSLGCSVINVQRSFERTYDISDRRVRPRLSLVGSTKTTGRRSVDIDIRL